MAIHTSHLFYLQGICAAKHCISNVVTASIEEVAFIAPVLLADIVHITAQVFTSSRSIDVEVSVQVCCVHT